MKTDSFSRRAAKPRRTPTTPGDRRPSTPAWVVFVGTVGLASGSCSLLDLDDCCWLDIDAVQSMVDSAGLAGIEVRARDRVFWAQDFKPSTSGTATVRLRVEDVGPMTASVQVVQAGAVAARGTMYWALAENTAWRLVVERSKEPTQAELMDKSGNSPVRSDSVDNEGFCIDGINSCRYKRVPIDDRLASYPGESLWLMLFDPPAKSPKGAIR